VVARVAVFFAVSIALIGCGGPQSSSAQVRSVVERFLAALESGNGAEVCSLLTDEAREQIVRSLRLFQPALKRGIDCTKLITPNVREQSRDAAALRELKSTKVGAVTLMGNHATVLVTQPSQGPLEAPLVKTAHGWRINELLLPLAAPSKVLGG
jgi:hypothetical protein